MHIENMKLDFDNGLNYRAEDIFPNSSPCVVFRLKWNQNHFKVIIRTLKDIYPNEKFEKKVWLIF